MVRRLAVGYIALAAFLFGLCILCLTSSYRHAPSRAERNQVQWILLASLISLVLIAYLLAQAWIDPATLGRGNAAWPMFGVSLLYTMAYAFSITRYKLMQVEDIINRSAVYFAFSLTAGLIYSGVLLVSGKLIGDQLFSTHSTSRGAVAAALSVFVVLILSEVARGRFQRVIDRQFFREKYKFDRAMQKMRLAVGSLIDRVDPWSPAARGRCRSIAAGVGRTLPGGDAGATAATGGQPWPRARRAVARARPSAGGSIAANARGPAFPRPGTQTVRSDPATDAMIALGGEAATSLGDDGQLSGLLVLGPKRSGMPYEDEEMAFLAALSSVATLVLHSADIQQTLESLNRELRDKVEKITEQQRRILILQDQLRDRAERERDSSGPSPERQLERAWQSRRPARAISARLSRSKARVRPSGK